MVRAMGSAAFSLVLLASVSHALGVIPRQNVNIQCVLLTDCPKLWNLAKESPHLESTVDLLRSSHCGFQGKAPMVFCPEVRANACKTPDNKSGTCVPIMECPLFSKILRSPSKLLFPDVQAHLRQLHCESASPSRGKAFVCCPTEKEVLESKPNPTIMPGSYEPPNKRRCGSQILNKVVGGEATEMDEFGWTAILEYKSRRRANTICAGSLVSERYVITAAHCVDNVAVKSVGPLTNVILGEYDTRNDTDCISKFGIIDCADPPVSVPVEKVTIYPQWYNRPTASINHDIALIRLARAVEFTYYIQPICLPSPSLSIKEADVLVVAGWGKTDNGFSSFIKRKALLKMANRQACVAKYRDDKKLLVGEGEICVGGERGKDTCSGDSGGPLMLSVNGGTWTLVGVISFGPNQPCGVKDYPGLYTYVPNYIDWIYQTMGS